LFISLDGPSNTLVIAYILLLNYYFICVYLK